MTIFDTLIQELLLSKDNDNITLALTLVKTPGDIVTWCTMGKVRSDNLGLPRMPNEIYYHIRENELYQEAWSTIVGSTISVRYEDLRYRKSLLDDNFR